MLLYCLVVITRENIKIVSNRFCVDCKINKCVKHDKCCSWLKELPVLVNYFLLSSSRGFRQIFISSEPSRSLVSFFLISSHCSLVKLPFLRAVMQLAARFLKQVFLTLLCEGFSQTGVAWT